MLNVLPVDRLEALVLVGNLTDSLSTNPPTVIPEWAGLLTGGRMQMISRQNICFAYHGLSVLIKSYRGVNSRPYKAKSIAA